MRAAIFRHGDFVVDTIADPKPAAGQVLVKTLCCGICGTDLHAAKFTEQFIERSARAVRALDELIGELRRVQVGATDAAA